MNNLKVNLYISFYKDKNPDRQKELKSCLIHNLKAGFDQINIFVENEDYSYIKELIDTYLSLFVGWNFIPSTLRPTIVITQIECRPAFNEYIKLVNTFENDVLHIVQNSDIYIDHENLNKIKDLNWDDKLFLALSRYDFTKEGNKILLDRIDSADCWIWKGKIKEDINIPCPCGYPGIDNRAAWEFKNTGYNVVNPSRDIVTTHLHLVKGNNYRDKGFGEVIGDKICPEPYYFHKPIYINEI